MFFVWGSPAQKTCDDIGIDEVGVHSFISETLLRIRFTDETSCPQVKCSQTKVFHHLRSLYRSTHPSPLSAHRGFFGNGHFAKANEWLRERYGDGEKINWAVLR